ncbi:hypothetical protein [Nodosilinea sp. P-1105]|uniref:hypothetical protein n=1 Tax=Nodosilinea sp. P-1105 TaxID=2546229 RepID=UPI00146D715B|nr:hypothetical protein [Nodosilinea sp. P-1105]NMF86709.1 hypothetical protein [Nodosilinea sp. P-1105]
MSLSTSIPPRNRLLALEQELQARRPVVGQRSPDQPPRKTQVMGTQAEAASATRASAPASQPTIQPPQHRRSPTPKTAPPLSPWQRLAARLTQTSLPDDSVSFSEPELTPPHVPSNPTNFAQEQSLPNVPLPTRPGARAPHSAVSSPPTLPSHAHYNQAVPPLEDAEDAVPSTSWKDLAEQIYQMRSPLVQHSRTTQPSADSPESFMLSVTDSQATVERPEPQPFQVEPLAAEHLNPLAPPPGATYVAPDLEAVADSTTAQPPPLVQAEPPETWEQDREDISTIDIAATAVDPAELSSDTPVEAVTETAIVPIGISEIVSKNGGTLLPHSPSDWGALAQILSIRAGPPKLAPRSLLELPPGSTDSAD